MRAFVVAAALLPFAAPAPAQDAPGTITYGILEPEAAGTYGIELSPGEAVVGFYAAPSIVRIPLEGTATDIAPAVEIDRVTGLPRNTPGWTGDDTEPAGIGCFPQGVCAALNE